MTSVICNLLKSESNQTIRVQENLTFVQTVVSVTPEVYVNKKNAIYVNNRTNQDRVWLQDLHAQARSAGSEPEVAFNEESQTAAFFF